MAGTTTDGTVSQIAGRFTTTIDNWVGRWQRGLTESRNGSYSLQKWISDLSSSWSEAASLAAFPWRVIDPATLSDQPARALISLEIDGTKDEVVEAAEIADPGTPSVDVTSLVLDKNNSIPMGNVKVDLCGQGRLLVVRVQGVKGLVGGAMPLAKGTYAGSVTPTGKKGPEVASISVAIV